MTNYHDAGVYHYYLANKGQTTKERRREYLETLAADLEWFFRNA